MDVGTWLVTGGTGFFGRALLRHWLAQSADDHPVPQVVVLARDPRGFLNRYPEFSGLPWLAFHAGDVLVPDSLPRAAFSHVLHAATDSALGPRIAPLDLFRLIIDGTRNLLDLAVVTGARRFLLTSSGAVYGPQPPDLPALPEEWPGSPDPGNPANAYGIGKRAAEHLCALYQHAHGIETVIARGFAFVGPDLPLDAHFAIGNFIRDALHGTEIVIAGDGTPVRSYLDQRDLARWLLAILEKGKAGRAYNVGSDQAVTMEELAHLVCDVIRPGLPVRKLGKQGVDTSRNRYLPDITRARSELALDITVSLADAIGHSARTVAARGKPKS